MAAPLASPLRQLNTQGHAPQSKLQHSWHALTHNPLLFTQGNPAPSPDRWFADFFCLKPSAKAQSTALAALSTLDLTGPYQHNISLLFSNAVRVLKSAPAADVTRSNAVETLIPLCRDVLGRRYPDQSEDVLAVLAGGLDRSDQVFTDLVSAIDLTLQDSHIPLTVRHRTLQLALIIVASVNQGALVAFFLRRDLFSTLVSFIADRETQHFAFESALLLGLLANYRKSEARNPYGVRIEDFVEEGVMERIIDVTATVCLRARNAYIALADDTPASFVASLSSLVWSTLRLSSEFFTGGFALPPPPPPPGAARRKGKERAVEGGSEAGEGDSEPDRPVPSLTINGGEPPLSPVPEVATPVVAPTAPDAPAAAVNGESSAAASTSASFPSPAPAPALAPAPTPSPSPKPRAEDAPFAALPPAMLVLLLPFYELLNSNKTFCSLVFGPRSSPSTPPLPETLISLTSYLVCHASVSPRARLYARLSLVLCMILVEEGEGKLSAPSTSTGEEGTEGIRVCRQRHPMLPQRDPARVVPLSAMIDAVVVFLRHNLRKRLDVETYAVALRLLQRTFQQLKAERVRLARDWVIVWRAMLSLASFIVSHSIELRSFSDKVDTLISQLFITLAYAAYWAAQLLPSPAAQAELFYEILHADATLSALSDLLGITSIASPVVPQTSSSGATTPTGAPPFPPFNRRDTPTRANFFALQAPISPAKGVGAARLGGGGGSGGGFVATECISNLRSVITFFSGPINQLRLTKAAADEVDPEELLAVIEANLGGVELIESAAMGDLRRYAAEEGSKGGATEEYFRRLGEVACADTLALMEGEVEV
ncbi:hypothetical protein JCM10449v2_003007 [Rhodotorula kratochvilovae]